MAGPDAPRRAPPASLRALLEELRAPWRLSGTGPAPARATRPLSAGLFNPVHPQAVQVLGSAGAAYLDSLAADARARLPAVLRKRGLAALIAAADAGACDLTAWAQAGIAVLHGDAPAQDIAHALRQALLARAPQRTVHGVMLEVHGTGVLIEGPAASGKSSLALELLSRGHALVADDAVELSRPAPGILLGRAPRLLRGYLEARGLGVLDVRRMHGTRALRGCRRLDLLIRLVPGRGRALAAAERLTGRRAQRRLLGEPVPVLSLPAGRAQTGHNLAALVEAAALDRRLRLDGIEPDAELARRQARAIRSSS